MVELIVVESYTISNALVQLLLLWISCKFLLLLDNCPPPLIRTLSCTPSSRFSSLELNSMFVKWVETPEMRRKILRTLGRTILRRITFAKKQFLFLAFTNVWWQICVKLDSSSSSSSSSSNHTNNVLKRWESNQSQANTGINENLSFYTRMLVSIDHCKVMNARAYASSRLRSNGFLVFTTMRINHRRTLHCTSNDHRSSRSV